MANSFDIFRRGERVEWPGSTHHSWVVRLQGRDEAAWEQLLELYAPAVFRWCRRLGVEGEDLVDVAQDVLVGACRGIDAFLVQENSSFRGWLWTLTKHRAIDYFRRRQRRIESPEGATNQAQLDQLSWFDPQFEFEEPDDGEIHPDALQDQRRKLQVVLEVLRSRYQPQTWDAFWRTVVGDEAPEHVAQDLGLSVNSVYLARSRVLRMLREELAGLSGG